METYTLSQLKALIKKQGYKHIGLRTLEGTELVKYNPNTIKVEKRLEDITTRLSSPTIPDGYYIVGCKYLIAKDAQSDDYMIVKGVVKDLPPAPKNITVDTENVLSYTEALKMQNKIAQLEAKNESLEKERDDYKDKYDTLMLEVREIMDDDGEEEETLSEPANNMATALSELVTTLLPVAERHYDLQDRHLKLQEGAMVERLHRQQNGIPQAVQDLQQNSQQEFQEIPDEQLAQMSEIDQNAYRINQLAHLAMTDPTEYNRVIAEMNGNA